jgi:hypothetical protein
MTEIMLKLEFSIPLVFEFFFHIEITYCNVLLVTLTILLSRILMQSSQILVWQSLGQQLETLMSPHVLWVPMDMLHQNMLQQVWFSCWAVER